MASHVRILGILHIAMGALGVLGGIVVLAVFGGIAGIVGAAAHSDEALIAIPILGGIGGLVAVGLMVLGLPGIIAGWGLLNYRPWARILTIILSAFSLMNVPMGTALGVYGFWVLLSTEGERLFSAPSAHMMRP